jgi:DNA polymerase III epsilon subunit family exonuclease
MDVVVVLGIVLIAIGVLTVLFRQRAPEPKPHIYVKERSTAPPPTVAIVPPKAVELSALLPQQFVVLDLETTGLNSAQDEIIEFGAIRVTLNSENQVAFRTLVKPHSKVPRKIAEITGITQEMVDKEGIQLGDALNQFMEFIGDLPLVTYNAEFDMGFLYSAAKKHGVAIKNRYTCALKRARRAWPGLPSYRLVDLAKMGKLSDEDTHRAFGDCMRAMFVFTAATSELGQKVRWSKPPSDIEARGTTDALLETNDEK